MGLDQLNFEGKNKVEVAIMRLQEFESPEGYYFADSYGKDSCATGRLLDMAAVKHDAHYSQGGIDPPELVRFGREYHPDTIIDRPEMSIWKGILIHGMPRRQSRWCCELIKEKHGTGRIVVTGIRWAESPRRKMRRMFEVCRTDGTKSFLHPIIDWTTKEVWEFIHRENIPYCSLYNEGFKRLGCVLCPMTTAKQTQFELIRFPKLAEAWRRACERYFDKGTEGVVKRWNSAEEMWQWWISRKGEPKISDAQCIMFDN
jgi:phosphoadenosine phosphosulfate reductase